MILIELHILLSLTNQVREISEQSKVRLIRSLHKIADGLEFKFLVGYTRKISFRSFIIFRSCCVANYSFIFL